MDDITIGCHKSTVANDVSHIKINGGTTYGVHLNDSKCELIRNMSSPPTSALEPPMELFSQICINDCNLLGSPIMPSQAMDISLAKKVNEMEKASERLQLITAHDALVLVRASCSAPKLMHMLRSSPCAGHSALVEYDNILRSCLIKISNVNIDDHQWLQASLPVKSGGPGMRSVASIASPAFLASSSSTQHLQTQLLRNCTESLPDLYFDQMLASWCDRFQPLPPPTGILAAKQRAWDKLSIDATFSTLLASQTDDYHKARLLAVCSAHSGDWLNTLPISSCGLRLDNDAIRIAIGLRLGANLCEPYVCICGALVNTLCSHCLSCKRSSGRSSRHGYINDIIYHSLVKAGIPCTKEPSGLLRTDGKRPDGLTSVPWQAGKCAIWDVTVTDTLATSYLSATASSAGSAAELAATRKEAKYSLLSSDYHFIPLALETLGPVGSKATTFLRQLGRRMSTASEDPRETTFLFQRLSIAIQRFNAVCFQGSFGDAPDID